MSVEREVNSFLQSFGELFIEMKLLNCSDAIVSMVKRTAGRGGRGDTGIFFTGSSHSSDWSDGGGPVPGRVGHPHSHFEACKPADAAVRADAESDAGSDLRLSGERIRDTGIKRVADYFTPSRERTQTVDQTFLLAAF